MSLQSNLVDDYLKVLQNTQEERFEEESFIQNEKMNYRNKIITSLNSGETLKKELFVESINTMVTYIRNYFKGFPEYISSNMIVRTNGIGGHLVCIIFKEEEEKLYNLLLYLYYELLKNFGAIIFKARIGNEIYHISEKEYLIYPLEVSGTKFKLSVHTHSFLQVNYFTLPLLYEVIVNWIEKLLISYVDKKIQHLLGIGDDSPNILTVLGGKLRNRDNLKIQGFVHQNLLFQSHLETGEANNQLNELNIDYGIMSSIPYLDRICCEVGERTILITNPGRKGHLCKDLELINQNKDIEYFLYMACNLESFKRDFRCLDNFKIIKVQGFNQFPGTYELALESQKPVPVEILFLMKRVMNK